MVHGEAKKRLSVDTAPVNFSTTTTIELSILGEQKFLEAVEIPTTEGQARGQ